MSYAGKNLIPEIKVKKPDTSQQGDDQIQEINVLLPRLSSQSNGNGHHKEAG